jgi:hypothetical protein
MFLRAEFNPAHRRTGIWAFTVHERGRNGYFKPAELIVLECGDFAWHGRGFLSWGDFCRFRSDYRIDDAMRQKLHSLSAHATDAGDDETSDRLIPWHFAERNSVRLPA